MWFIGFSIGIDISIHINRWLKFDDKAPVTLRLAMAKTNHNSQEYLLSSQYKSADNLKARIALYENYGKNKVDFHDWLFNHIDVANKSKVLELGSGSARIWQKNKDRIPQFWDITLSDFSEGMLAETKKNVEMIEHDFHFLQIDIQNIPFEEGSFDMVMANHMLYHVPNLEKALMEVKRVLKDGGKFYAALNGVEHMLELKQLIKKISALYPPNIIMDLNNISITLESGEKMLGKYFNKVEVLPFNSEIVVDKAEPIMAYIMSLTALQELENMIKKEELEDLLEQTLNLIKAELSDKSFRIRTNSGLLIAG